MPDTLHIRCNGPEQHVNAIDLEAQLRPVLAARADRGTPPLPARLVLPCRFCTVGQVVLTRAMIEQHRRTPRP